MEHNFLILENGSVFPGMSMGREPLDIDALNSADDSSPGAGEVVFNTAMAGYHEVLTDPSYTGQLVAMTYPHIGNYGTSEAWNEAGPESALGRTPIKASGMIVRRLYGGVISDERRSLHAFLASNGVPGISEVDTRALTLQLRTEGSCNGVIVKAPTELESSGDGLFLRAARLGPKELARDLFDAEQQEIIRGFFSRFPDMEGRNLLSGVGSSEPSVYNQGGSPHIGFLDYGAKRHIVELLTGLGARITIYPSSVSTEQILESGVDACGLSNGPGDPAVLEEQVEAVKGLVGRMPLFGVCLGHQLIAEAVGATTYKMKFGHHGVNHPVRDEKTGRVFVTSQNHGFAVSEESLPEDVSVRFRNANDGTVEGLESPGRHILTAQFHPEAAPGPHDCRWIFQEFVESLGTSLETSNAGA